MQPLQLAGDAKARFVKMANLRLGHALADELVDLLQLLRLLSDPGDDAGRTDQRRAEEIAQRLRGPILGDELLDIEIDRRRLDALAILGGRDHAIGKRRLGHAAAIFAAVNRGLMLGDHERALDKIEHLALLDLRGPPRIERRTAMAACARLVPNRAIGIGDLQQKCRPRGRSGRRSPCPSGRAGCPGCEASSSTRRSKGAWNCSSCPAPTGGEVRHFSLKRRNPPLQRGDQLFDFGRENHPTLDSDSQPVDYANPPTKLLSTIPVTFRTSPSLGVTPRQDSASNTLKSFDRR